MFYLDQILSLKLLLKGSSQVPCLSDEVLNQVSGHSRQEFNLKDKTEVIVSPSQIVFPDQVSSHSRQVQVLQGK